MSTTDKQSLQVSSVDTTQRFAQFEGMDGSGKTSLIKHTASIIRGLGYKVAVLRMPGGLVPEEGTSPPFVDGGEDVRRFFLANRKSFHSDAAMLLSLAAYRQNLIDHVRPVLDEGGYVLCDRGVATIGAYHNLLLNSDHVPAMTFVGHQDQLMRHQFPISVYFDVSFETSLERMGKRTQGDDGAVLDITERKKFDDVRGAMLRMQDLHRALFSGRQRYTQEQIGSEANRDEFVKNTLIPKLFPELANYFPTDPDKA